MSEPHELIAAQEFMLGGEPQLRAVNTASACWGPVSQASESQNGPLQTVKLPSDVFLWAAGASIVGSLALKMSGDDKDAQFVGQWAPTFLLLGLYNKIVKLHGSE